MVFHAETSRVLRTAVVLAALALLSAAPIIYATCWGGSINRGAYASNTVTNKGIKGATDVTAANAVDPNTTIIAHPAQVLSLAGTDFLGWGTKKGAGTTGGSHNCPATGNTSWAIYKDGIAFGAYFCFTGYGTVANSSTGQTFQVLYTLCMVTTPYENKWVFSWNGTAKTCHTMNSTSGITVAAGGESVDPQNRIQDISVHFFGMKYYKPSVGWEDFGTIYICEDLGYDLLKIGNTNWWARPA